MGKIPDVIALVTLVGVYCLLALSSNNSILVCGHLLLGIYSYSSSLSQCSPQVTTVIFSTTYNATKVSITVACNTHSTWRGRNTNEYVWLWSGGLFNCTSWQLVFQQVHPLPPLLIHPQMRDHPLLLIHEHSQVRKMIARVLTAFLSVLVNVDLNGSSQSRVHLDPVNAPTFFAMA